MKKIKFLALFLALAMTFTACANKPKGAVAKVGKEYVTKEDFDSNYSILRNMYYGTLPEEEFDKPGQDGMSQQVKLGNQVIDMLVMDEIVKQELKKNKVEVSEEDINKQIENMKTASGSEEAFKAQLDNYGITEEEFRSLIAQNARTEALMNNFISKNAPSDAERQKYFDENKDKLIKYDVSHILVDTEEEAKEIEKSLKEGKEFEELAKEKSKDPGSAVNGGELGEITMQTPFVQEFLDKVKEMKVEEISEPVKSQFGYHIIRLNSISGSVEELKDVIDKELVNPKYQEYISNLYKVTPVEKYSPAEYPKVETKAAENPEQGENPAEQTPQAEEPKDDSSGEAKDTNEGSPSKDEGDTKPVEEPKAE